MKCSLCFVAILKTKMKLLISLICAFLSFSISADIVSVSNNASQSSKDFDTLMPTTKGINAKELHKNTKANYSKYKPSKSCGGINEYILLTEESGKIAIIDANTYELVANYDLPEVQFSLVAIVDNTLYNIDTVQGKIFSTAVENIMTSDTINWNYDGWFPSEQYWVRGGTAVLRSSIYFVTHSGVLYEYDTNLKTVTKIKQIGSSWYTSAVVINNILYLSNYYYLYSYDGSVVKSMPTPDYRNFYGLFRDGSLVCKVGGNKTDIYPDPVHCYDPSLKVWKISSYINEARWYPGVVRTSSRTYVFGGHCWYASDGLYQYDLKSSEVFDHERKTWAYIPTPLSEEPGLV